MRPIPATRKLILLTIASLALTASFPVIANAQSDNPISYDATRNVFTMAPIIKKVTPGVVSISTVKSEEADGHGVAHIVIASLLMASTITAYIVMV